MGVDVGSERENRNWQRLGNFRVQIANFSLPAIGMVH